MASPDSKTPSDDITPSSLSAGSRLQITDDVYQNLRRIAQAIMNVERRDHTLQATALVHEAWLSLNHTGKSFDNKTHLLNAAAEAMRNALVDHARARGRVKRGGDPDGTPPVRVPRNVIELASSENSDHIMRFEAWFRRLEKRDARAAQVVNLHFWLALSVRTTAEALDISEATVSRDWLFARAELIRELNDDQGTTAK